MRKLTVLLAAAVTLVAMAVAGSALAGKPGPNPCSTGTLNSGAYGGFTVSGTCFVAASANVTINGNLKLAEDAVFRGMFVAGTLHVTGNVKVDEGAILGLGYGTTVVVDGNIKADEPKSLYIGEMTVHGNVDSNGGGTADRFYNFPIKDNTIDGNLKLHGWHGGWIGAIRNTVGGNVDFSDNASVVEIADAAACGGTFPAGCAAVPGTDGDSSEVQTNIISGNLKCHGNTPVAQVNPNDGGQLNTVTGNKKGECAGL